MSITVLSDDPTKCSFLFVLINFYKYFFFFKGIFKEKEES